MTSRVARTLNSLWVVPVIARVLDTASPRTVLSFTTRPNIVNVLARRLSKVKFRCVIAERNFNSIQYDEDLWGKLFKMLMQWAYPRADLVVANASALASDLNRRFGVPPEKLRVIYSPFNIEEIQVRAAAGVELEWFYDSTPIILNVARLIPQKNQELLIRAFARVRQEMSCRLVIVGEGELRSFLMQLAQKLGVANDILFVGWDDNPFKYMSKATVFVLTSNYEGLPAVIVEAMASGCPVISTDCPSGPQEILCNGEYGMLVPVGDEAGLAERIKQILKDDEMRNRFVELGRQRACEFKAEKIINQFKEIL